MFVNGTTVMSETVAATAPPTAVFMSTLVKDLINPKAVILSRSTPRDPCAVAAEDTEPEAQVLCKILS